MGCEEEREEMAATTLQTITQQTSTMTEIKEFLVPTILSVNLKKTTEDRLPILENENPNKHVGESSRSSTPGSVSENVDNKNFPILLDHENSTGNLEILDSGEDDEDVVEMAPLRNKRPAAFLMDPFMKSEDPSPEGNKENPVLKALFGGRSSPTRFVPTSISACHPFKKTELSQDVVSDGLPIQIPKSLLKKPSRSRKSSPVQKPPSRSASVLKEIQLEPAKSPESPKTVLPPTEPPVTVSPKSDNSSSSNNNSSSSNSNRGSDAKMVTSSESKSSHKKKKSASQQSVRPRVGYINSERLIQLKGIVDAAIRDHKVYSMTGCYNSVRNALKQRGWIEKIDSDFKGRRRQNKYEEIDDAAFQFVQKNTTQAAMRNSSQCNSDFATNDQIHYTGQGEAEIINRMLRNITEDLCWLSRPYPYYCWKDIGKYDMVNRLPKAYFSNKEDTFTLTTTPNYQVGLCNSLQQIQWFYEPGVCSTQYPRTYNISLKDEYEAFKDDFRITSCICILKWLVNNFKTGGEKAVRSPDGKVDVNVIEFALRRCAEYVKSKEHEDIDLPETPIIWEHQWDHFLTQYYKVINEGHILRDCKDDPAMKVIITNAQTMLNLIKPHWPQMDIEGIHNYWIVKPGGRCCGNGIVIKNNLEQILTIVNPTITRETRYVVQKYIERPLLIYNTKFDIRQWFLVTNVYPLTIWMYKESYLRFCSQPFSLKTTHESVHLCNNAVQRKYKNPRRDRGLPDENMWDCYTFQTYLKAMGHPDVWDKHIYPGMKEGFIGALLASQDSMERRKNCFELYGADFMVSDNLTDGPWLIEINSNPAMDSSTSVTARMCPQVLEDIVKVVIDRRDDKSASTGAFEMIFKQNCPPIPPYLGMSLSIKGKKVYRPSSDPKLGNKKSKGNHSSDTLVDSETEEDSSLEENIVEKRCTTDFMQPIKTLIETIQGGYSPSDMKQDSAERAELSSAEETDSAHYDSDSSEASDSSRLMALEGKEMELRKKSDSAKLDDKKAKSKKEEETNKRKKIDWIRKNIEDVKSNGKAREEKNKEEPARKVGRSREAVDVLGSEELSCPKSCRLDSKSKTTHEELETIFREEIIKMLDTIECKKFMELGEPALEKQIEKMEAMEEVWEPESVESVEMFCGDVKEDVEIPEAPPQSISIGTKTLEPEENNMSLLSISDFTDYELEETERNAGHKNENLLVEPADTCCDFDSKFEKELKELEVKEADLKEKLDMSGTLSINPQGLLLKKKARGAPRWNNNKSSMDYFREWKYKVDETRRTCEDMLAKLRVFKEANSKLKFHDALRKRMEDEAQFIKRLKQFRTTKNFVKMNKNVARKKLVRVSSEEELFKEEAVPEVLSSSTSERASKNAGRHREPRFTVRLYDLDLPLAEPPLAISSESGAVRNVSQTLPKIKQRNRPLLPNASSGHGRKMDVVAEKMMRKKFESRLK